MSRPRKAHAHAANGVSNQHGRFRGMVSYPPPATGVNANIVPKVEHHSGDRVIWHVIQSPDGQFVYDYRLIRQQHIERMCFDCRRVKVSGIKRLCNTCANIRKRTSNRKSQSKRRSTVRKTGFWPLHAEALTDGIYASGSAESPPDKTSVSNAL